VRRVLPLVVVAACFGGKDTIGLPCDFTSQCNAGQSCVMGKCVGFDEDTGGETAASSGSIESSTTTAPAGDLPPCVPFLEDVAPLRSRIVLVLDVSRAAAVTWNDDNNGGTPEIPRYDSLRASLNARLPELDPTVDLGLALAPSGDATAVPDVGACAVDAAPQVGVAEANAAVVLGALPGAASPGAAPIAGAMQAAIDALAASTGPQPHAVVLVLAGAANCSAGARGDAMFESYADELHGVVAAGRDDGIPTAVVGVGLPDEPYPELLDGFPDGVNPHDKAQLLADDGGLPRPAVDKYYRAMDGINLGNSIRDAFFAARRCVLPLPAQLAGVSFEVLVAGAPIDEVASCADGDGFVVGTDTVEICGSACGTLKADEATATLRVECG